MVASLPEMEPQGGEAAVSPHLIDFRRVPTERIRDPLRTQQNILEVATELFAEHGLAGARIDQISELTQTTKRMIYYYFGSKEGLYEAVLERAYLYKWQADSGIDLATTEPVEGLRQLVGAVFDAVTQNPTFTRLIAAENINRGRFLGNLRRLRGRVPPVVQHLERLLERGRDVGRFRDDVDHWDIYWLVSATSTYGVVGYYSAEFLDEARDRPTSDGRHRAISIEAVIRFVMADRRSYTAL